MCLQVSQVVPPSPPCTVFLDLSWPGSGPRRVQVRLPRDITLARQFLLLCTGQRGASYAPNTRLYEVVNKGQPREFVRGGDYDGRGGAALLPGLDNGGCWASGQAGAVCWPKKSIDNPAQRGAQFAITTRDREAGMRYNSVFGEVVQGLDVFVAAAQHHPINDVTVVDCGVVLWV